MTRTDEYLTEKEMEEMQDRKRRSTIKVLHTVYSILKSMIPSLTQFAKLIRNYHINKEYVKSQQKGNLNLMYEAVMAIAGLVKKIDKKTTDMYTVRTLELYNYIKESLPEISTGNMTADITYNQAKTINTWLSSYDNSAKKIDLSKDNFVLYFDHEAILEQYKEQQRIKDQYGLDTNNLSKYKNGTFSGIDKISINGDSLLYTDSRLPMNSSQIIEAMSKLKRN